MIAFHLRLVARSMRWLGAAIIVLIWMLISLSDPGPALSNAGSGFLLLFAVACWITVVTGNVDDDGHRELVTASVGSPARLHRLRALSAWIAANAIGVVVTLTALVASSHPVRPASEATVVAACIAVQLSATAIGVGCGALLHRPVVRHLGITLFASVAVLVALVLFPPTQHLFRQLNDGRTGGLVIYAAGAVVLAVVAVTAGSLLADRRN
ncbi:MAG TPA: hypothetical protein VGO03_03110 [Acidimicrobiia bacterium]|jgi:hypothetical protein